jgi:2-polyprenyl-3-methyl-5-hydroxy-6-metoxy-1,4-benzoquinol methylase
MEYYKEKQGQYFSNARFDLISLIPQNKANKVLEIGAGAGDTLVAIKSAGLAMEVVGAELLPLNNTNQDHPMIDRFIICDIEKDDLDLSSGYFDVILMGDVLEHLIDPWNVIGKLSHFLKPGGLMIASVPNIRYYPAMIKVFLKGSFEYEQSGTFDKTHLRFFCKKDLIELFKQPGLNFHSITSINNFQNSKSKGYLFNLLTNGLFEEFLSQQYVITVKKE